MVSQDLASFGILPSAADKVTVEPSAVHIPDADVEHFTALIKLSRLAPLVTRTRFPTTALLWVYGETGWRRPREHGRTNLTGMQAVHVSYCLTSSADDAGQLTLLDRRKTEEELNAWPHFRARLPIGDSQLEVHFVGLFSQHPDATPLLLLHGWPGSFLEFLPLLALLTQKYGDAKSLPYHVIVPSLPGYGLSEAPPVDRDFGLEDVARLYDHLLVKVLGLRGYVAQAGDVGARVSCILAAQYEHCRGTLLNFSPVPEPPGVSRDGLEAYERKGLERYNWFMEDGRAYALMQASRPSTLGLVLSATPLAVLAWVGEKFLEWSDPSSFPADSKLPGTQTPYSRKLMKEVLTSASLYWLSGHAHTCFYSYREGSGTTGRSHATPAYHIHVPKKLGFAYFPLELAPTPRSWIATTGNLVFWRAHERGGHFAAFEQPEVLLADLEAFVAEEILENKTK